GAAPVDRDGTRQADESRRYAVVRAGGHGEGKRTFHRTVLSERHRSGARPGESHPGRARFSAAEADHVCVARRGAARVERSEGSNGDKGAERDVSEAQSHAALGGSFPLRSAWNEYSGSEHCVPSFARSRGGTFQDRCYVHRQAARCASKLTSRPPHDPRGPWSSCSPWRPCWRSPATRCSVDSPFSTP